MPLKRILPKYGRRQVDFRASTSELITAPENKSMNIKQNNSNLAYKNNNTN